MKQPDRFTDNLIQLTRKVLAPTVLSDRQRLRLDARVFTQIQPTDEETLLFAVSEVPHAHHPLQCVQLHLWSPEARFAEGRAPEAQHEMQPSPAQEWLFPIEKLVDQMFPKPSGPDSSDPLFTLG